LGLAATHPSHPADTRADKRAALNAAMDALDRLQPPPQGGTAETVEARNRVLESIDRQESGATNDAVTALGTYVDEIASQHPFARSAPDAAEGFFKSFGARNRAVASGVVVELERAIVRTLRARTAFFERIEADNESSLARLYSRYGTETH
jgi:hypothetical protein